MVPRTGTSVAAATARRDLLRSFNNPVGYVFVTLFIFLSAAAAFWQPRFFLNNLANLDQLNALFPLLLLLFVPALTMSVWSEEKKQGTDELLLTLPATDLDVVLGKYLAVVGIYTPALVLSASHLLVLMWLGTPDPGLMAANYLGYWLAGIALIPVGMLASLLTTNAAVAFILGVAFTAGPVLIATVAGVFDEAWERAAGPLGVYHHFEGFAQGVISVAGLVYFAGVAVFFLYLNVLLLSRRHWPSRMDGLPAWLQHGVRASALLVILFSLTIMCARMDARLDVTAERLQTVADETRHLLDSLPADRPVLIQAFVSPVVPEAFVQTRENLVRLLREVDQLGGARVELLLHDTVPFSDAARIARERFGINASLVPDQRNVSAEYVSVFLGVAFRSGAEEQVIPFVDRGLSPEYEIARAIRMVTRASRKRVGVVDTDAKILGGVDFMTGRPRQPWTVVTELRKQYDLVEIVPDQPIAEKVDALMVVLPNTLLHKDMAHVADAIQRGLPTLLVVDPLPAMDMSLAPAASAAAAIDPYQKMPTIRKNVGDVQAMLASLGVKWNAARVVWDSYRPHPGLGQMPNEIVFAGPGSGNPEAFNSEHPATAGLQELVMLYPARLEASDPDAYEFVPLARTGKLSGTVGYFQLVRPSEQGPFLNVGLEHQPDEGSHVLAAHVRSRAGRGQVNTIVVGDLDFIGDQFFDMRAADPSATFDNITFFLNALDVLAKDEGFIKLRRRRARHRTLERIEAQTRTFMEQRAREQNQAEKDAERALAAAVERVKKLAADVGGRTDLDAQARQIAGRNIEATEKRRLEVVQVNIERQKNARLQASREAMEGQVQRIQSGIRTAAVLLPPIPVLCLGVMVAIRRYRRARASAAAVRRLRSAA